MPGQNPSKPWLPAEELVKSSEVDPLEILKIGIALEELNKLSQIQRGENNRQRHFDKKKRAKAAKQSRKKNRRG